MHITPDNAAQDHRESIADYQGMSEFFFALAGIQFNPERLPSIALEQIIARFDQQITPRIKWVTVDADGEIFGWGERPEAGELFDMFHRGDLDTDGPKFISKLLPAMIDHLRLATHWRDYIVEVNQ